MVARGSAYNARWSHMPRSDGPSPPVLAGEALRAAIRRSGTGIARGRSDIDVGILGPRPVPGTVLQQIRDELERLRTLRVFDVVDFSGLDESFRTEALKHAERL